MDEHLRDVYLHEVEAQCAFALNAIGGLNSVLARLPKDEADNHVLQQEVFRSIHSFLTHSSNISRLLWPASRKRAKGETREEYQRRAAADWRLCRGKELRVLLGLPDHGHLLRNRKMRDHLEHFDERLDEWQRTSPSQNYVQDCIGPANVIVGIDPKDVMRWFDPATKCFRFRGEQYDLQASVAAVEDVYQRVAQQLRAGLLARLRVIRTDAV